MNIHEQYFGPNGHVPKALGALKAIAKAERSSNRKTPPRIKGMIKRLTKSITLHRKQSKNQRYKWELDLIPNALDLLDQIGEGRFSSTPKSQLIATQTTAGIRKRIDYFKKQFVIQRQRQQSEQRKIAAKITTEEARKKIADFQLNETLSKLPGRYVESTQGYQPIGQGQTLKIGSNRNNN